MAKVYEDGISDSLAAWIHDQPVFFVATAPSSGGHVNLSPKGYDTLRVLSANQVAYRDYTGSGAETAAHLRDDGRITLMWTAFEGNPRIARVHGTGRLITETDDAYAKLDEILPDPAQGARAIVVIDADRVSTSCGFGVPLMELVGERDIMADWANKKGPEGIAAYQDTHNRTSIDGLPALPEPVSESSP